MRQWTSIFTVLQRQSTMYTKYRSEPGKTRQETHIYRNRVNVLLLQRGAYQIPVLSIFTLSTRLHDLGDMFPSILRAVRGWRDICTLLVL
jgi:hypothetical protein